MRDDLKKKFGEDFSAREFHDLIIYEGSIPICLGREYYPAMLKESLQKQAQVGI